MPKHHPKQMSLVASEYLGAFISGEVPGETYLDKVLYVAYVENTNRDPQNFPEGSEAWNQWTYTGRKKKDKETLKRASQSNNP
jgi:hypothetical protein